MQRVLFFTIISASLFLLFFQLEATPLVNWDEAWFASVARSMLQNGDFLNGQWNGNTWFYEPPLVTWILAGSLSFFGSSSFSLRFFNAAGGFFIILTTYVLARELFKNHWSGFFSTLILLTDIEFLFRSRQINTDILLTLLLLTSFYTLVQARETNKRKWFTLSGISFALAILTKRASPFLAIPAFLVLLFFKNTSLFKRNELYFGIAAFLLVVSPWFLLNLHYWGNTFVSNFIFSFTLNKLTSINPATGTDPLFYVHSLKHAFKLLSSIFPFAFFWLLFKARRDTRLGALIIFIMTFFGLMTVTPIKASWYLMPIHPFLALSGGGFLAFLFRKTKLKSAFLGIITVVSLFQLWNWRDQYMVPPTTSHQVVMVEKAKELTQSGDTIYLDDDYLPIAVFYSERPVIPLRFNRIKEQMVEKIDIPSGSLILTNTQTISNLQTRLQRTLLKIFEFGDLLLVRVD